MHFSWESIVLLIDIIYEWDEDLREYDDCIINIINILFALFYFDLSWRRVGEADVASFLCSPLPNSPRIDSSPKFNVQFSQFGYHNCNVTFLGRENGKTDN